jgi:hypothetical protein
MLLKRLEGRMLQYNLTNISDKTAYPQNSSTLSKLMTFLMSSIQPEAPEGVGGTAVEGVPSKARLSRQYGILEFL